jgi:hypothetical protein
VQKQDSNRFKNINRNRRKRRYMCMCKCMYCIYAGAVATAVTEAGARPGAGPEEG